MASTTTYLNLKLLGTSSADKAKLFEEWRQEISGENEGSNMQLIDAAFHELQQSATNYITPLQIDMMLAGEWT